MQIKRFTISVLLIVVIIAGLVAIAGCSTTPQNVEGVMCVVARNLTGTVVTMTAQLAKLPVNGGTLTINPAQDCFTTFTVDPKAVPPAKAASAP